MTGNPDPPHDLWYQLALLAANYPADEAVNLALGCLGRHHDADRVWVVRYNDELTHFWNTHEWARDGISEHVEDLQAASVDVIRWMHRQFLKGKIVPNPDSETLPRQARGYQAELRRQHILSSINVPLYHAGKLHGIFGYDMVRRHQAWDADLMAFLTEAARYFAGLLYSRPAGGQAASPPVHPSPRTLYIRTGDAVLAVDRGDLILIEADGDYTHLHFSNRHHCTELRSLKSWESQLPEAEFIRISQRHIVHNGRIRRLDRSTASGWLLHLHDWPEPLGVGRAYRHRIRQHLGF